MSDYYEGLIEFEISVFET